MKLSSGAMNGNRPFTGGERHSAGPYLPWSEGKADDAVLVDVAAGGDRQRMNGLVPRELIERDGGPPNTAILF